MNFRYIYELDTMKETPQGSPPHELVGGRREDMEAMSWGVAINCLTGRPQKSETAGVCKKGMQRRRIMAPALKIKGLEE